MSANERVLAGRGGCNLPHPGFPLGCFHPPEPFGLCSGWRGGTLVGPAPFPALQLSHCDPLQVVSPLVPQFCLSVKWGYY